MRVLLLVPFCSTQAFAFFSNPTTNAVAVTFDGWILPRQHIRRAETVHNELSSWTNGVIPGGRKHLKNARNSALFATADTTTSSSSSSIGAPPDNGFIATELRGAAMKLHTTQQAPKEGEVVVKEPKEKYVPSRNDYLAFLVDSKYVYEALEDIVNGKEELSQFRNTGLERTKALEQDIEFMVSEYGLTRPEVGEFGKAYATELRAIESIPEFMCHYYNFYFAHTAGGRMIGKQMSALLLDKQTLEFYKVRK
jgi:hypothetical protein